MSIMSSSVRMPSTLGPERKWNWNMRRNSSNLLHVKPRKTTPGNEWIWDCSGGKSVQGVWEEGCSTDVAAIWTSTLDRAEYSDHCWWIRPRWDQISTWRTETNPSRTESSPSGRRPRKKAGDWNSSILEMIIVVVRMWIMTMMMTWNKGALEMMMTMMIIIGIPRKKLGCLFTSERG